MKAVLISIQPKWCELIASGKKTVEVRKTKPKIEKPFKCYIYCTRGNGELIQRKGNKFLGYTEHSVCGKVIGEFVCDRIEEIGFSPYNHGEYICKDQSFIEQSCVPFVEMFEYLDEEYGYGWHISDLVIYDKPKELWEFNYPPYRDCDIECRRCKYGLVVNTILGDEFDCDRSVKRPPQSWGYVEEVDR